MTDSGPEPLFALHRLLDRQETAQESLDRVANLARTVISSVVHVGVTILDRERLTTAAATDVDALALDGAQYRSGDGPCLHAYRQGEPVEIESIEDDERWPSFNAAALAHGVRSSLSMPLLVENQSLGALNMYASTRGPFAEDDRAKAASFADQASIAMANSLSFTRVANLAEQLREALETRDVIGQAKGILMAKQNLTADQAFELLKTTSQRQNRKLHAIAEHVAGTGELPDT